MSVGAVLGVALLLLVPGVPASLALAPPGRLDTVTRLALAPVLGSVLVAFVAFILTVPGLLHPAAFFTGLGLITVALSFVVIRRDGGFLRHIRTDIANRQGDPWPVALGLAVVVAVAVVRWSFAPDVHFSAASGWRYWADAVEIADAGRVPPASLQYGTDLVPTVSKVFLNALNAGVSFVIGRSALPALGALLFVGSVGFAGVLWSLGRELGLRWTAPLLPLLMVANRRWLGTEVTTDLDAYRAETFGRMLAFGALALFVHAVHDRRPRREVAAAGAVMGAAAGMHLVPALIAIALAATYGLVVFLREPGRRATLVRGLVAAGAGLLVASAILLLPDGDVGLGGAGSDDVYAQFGNDFDPTLFVSGGITPGRQATEGPLEWTLATGTAYRAFVASALGQPAGVGLRPKEPAGFVKPLALPIALALVVLAVVALVWFPRDLRAAGVSPLALTVLLVGLTWWFTQRSRLFIPANFGIRRLYDYASVPLFLGALVLLEFLLLTLRRRPWPRRILALAMVGVASWAMLPRALLEPKRVQAAQPIIEPMRWVAENLPCDAFILANQHTEGFFQAGLGRPAALEGMTPYLRPKVLLPTIKLFLQARRFFRDPTHFFKPFAERGVTHVIVIRGGGLGYSAVVGKANIVALDTAPMLRLIHDTKRVRVYEVRDSARRADPPDATAYPGYHCVTDPEF